MAENSQKGINTIIVILVIILIIISVYLGFFYKPLEEKVKENVKAEEKNIESNPCDKNSCPQREIGADGKPTGKIVCVKKSDQYKECTNFDAVVPAPSLIYSLHR